MQKYNQELFSSLLPITFEMEEAQAIHEIILEQALKGNQVLA